jgi:act minimal PKS acyl carrier protein
MTRYRADQLTSLMISAAGKPEGGQQDGQLLNTTFTELGYDSLAVLEITGRIHKTWGIDIPESMAPDLQTPRLLLEYVNKTVEENQS